jgi:sialate O-acetylesterase
MMTYGCRFPAMIADWRTKWHAGSLGETAADFAFGFVNLAPWKVMRPITCTPHGTLL